MTKYVQHHRDTDDIREVVAEHDEYVWLKNSDGRLGTYEKEWWVDHRPTPKAGDVWVSKTGAEYRVLGVVDGKAALFAQKDKYAAGEFPLPLSPDGQVGASMSYGEVYVRSLPERYLTLKERL